MLSLTETELILVTIVTAFPVVLTLNINWNMPISAQFSSHLAYTNPNPPRICAEVPQHTAHGVCLVCGESDSHCMYGDGVAA